MVSSSATCDWGNVTPGSIDRCWPGRPERPFYTTFPVGEDEAVVINRASTGLTGVSVAKPNDPDASFALVFAPRASDQEIGKLTSAFLRNLVAVVDEYQLQHVSHYRTMPHLSERELTNAVATGSSRGW